MNTMKKWTYGAIYLATASALQAQPWIDTRDSWLRSDIETLAAIGVIQTPINTYPLMWSNILNDLNQQSLSTLSSSNKATYLRVLAHARHAKNRKSAYQLRVSNGSNTQVIRSFGASSREDNEAAVRYAGYNDFSAWNLEVTYVDNPVDDERIRFDNSYYALTLGNWVLSAGAQEKWWGPAWDSSLLLSNNARPAPGLMLQRNQSTAFETPWLSWIGPWTVTGFASLMEDEHRVTDFQGSRLVNDVKLIGLSINFRPLSHLEIGLRRTAQWGGEDRPESLSSLWDLAIGNDNCFGFELECKENEPGNQIAGLDLSWHLPFSHPLTVYGQIVGEDEIDGILPSQRIFTAGLSSIFSLGDYSWRTYLEFSDTAIWRDSPNIAYEHGIYNNGYRYYDRNIGSTFDNDSEVWSLGLIGNLTQNLSTRWTFQSFELNRDATNRFPHTISPSGSEAKRISAEFLLNTQVGQFRLELEYSDEIYDQTGRLNDEQRINLEWSMGI